VINAIEIAVVLLLSITLTACGGEPKAPSTDFANYKPLADAIAKAGKVVLYEGLPGEWSTDKPREEKTVQLHGYTLYEKQLVLSDETAKKLTALFCAEATFKKWGGLKKCGGFHPDFCVEWRNGEDVYQVLICFGCHEVKCYGPKQELYCDIQEDAYKQFTAILTPLNTDSKEKK
jgi:hypothetical protein